jgi:predicted XRE-type DNA-binding protein
MRAAKNESTTHITRDNVFLDIGFPPEKALALKFRAKILVAILDEVKRRKYRQAHLVKILNEHQPVVKQPAARQDHSDEH